jgi:hypothetical protein
MIIYCEVKYDGWFYDTASTVNSHWALQDMSGIYKDEIVRVCSWLMWRYSNLCGGTQTYVEVLKLMWRYSNLCGGTQTLQIFQWEK